MENLERIQARLENIRSVEPLIFSLRTIAAGGWRQALRRRQSSQDYNRYLSEILAATLPRVGREPMVRSLASNISPPRRVLVVVIGSERGLCGAYNSVVLRGAEQILTRQRAQSDEVLIGALGARVGTYFRRIGWEPFWEQAMPFTRVVSLEQAGALASELKSFLVQGRVDAIHMVYSPYNAAVITPPVLEQWLPLDLTALPKESVSWPEPFIETNLRELFHRALAAWEVARLYRILVEAAASEQAARYRTMDTASRNLKRLITELDLEYHTARQHAITMEMLDLASGAEALSRGAGRRE